MSINIIRNETIENIYTDQMIAIKQLLLLYIIFKAT